MCIEIEMIVETLFADLKKPTEEVTEEEWQRVFNVNVKAIFLGSQALMTRLIQQGQGGSMINISSTGASRPRPGLVWYNASKGAVSNVRHSTSLLCKLSF
jgi:NAD(P)-dependent dehydrogenase (short-subunit alcohol dehydrogenase family)